MTEPTENDGTIKNDVTHQRNVSPAPSVIPAKKRHPSEGWDLQQIPAYARMT
ncbi:hypothetical protein N9913_00115 [Porticoccaceae bacterium]|nr:hypothetical protein [Porticoccaceae bacterium]MDB4308691.1 hypothetical protein [Porticoccaceae bacterium]MDB9953035.1 hypothetical protein [Porticoccaceae bacterium]MDC0000044.1 hypothetical protein [Porticoccaceae bacterium]